LFYGVNRELKLINLAMNASAVHGTDCAWRIAKA
jgi:hypothetical protein